jgi:SPX domain protein involved in polyphosphate accumulation
MFLLKELNDSGVSKRTDINYILTVAMETLSRKFTFYERFLFGRSIKIKKSELYMDLMLTFKEFNTLMLSNLKQKEFESLMLNKTKLIVDSFSSLKQSDKALETLYQNQRDIYKIQAALSNLKTDYNEMINNIIADKVRPPVRIVSLEGFQVPNENSMVKVESEDNSLELALEQFKLLSKT